MSLERLDFAEFFATRHEGREPFAWQSRLLDHIIAEGRWPDRVVAPTGAGKTAVIDVHVFAVALMAVGVGPRVPRRLSLVVDRRALVDSQYDLARRMRAALRDAVTAEGGVLGEVARALRRLRTTGDPAADPLVVGLLRGGVPATRRWVDDPTACTILCATPDMWGSRLLFRGYGSSRLARPREAGVLAYDSVVVVDEAHLARQLVATARRIDVLESLADAPVPVPRLQVVAATATPTAEDGLVSIGVESFDVAADGPASTLLRQRLTAPKPVCLRPSPHWPATASGARQHLARQLADETADLLEHHGRTVACVCNTVATALATAKELERRGLVVETLVGRLRPYDVRALRERRPGLLETRGDPDVDVVVATQTIEVGIDCDFSAMVTELAPGSSIAQRAGRVNRVGQRPSAEIRVVVPDGAIPLKDVPPYLAADLAAGYDWLARRSEQTGGLAPWQLMSDPPPEASPRRIVFGRPEPWDALLLARTSDDLVDEPDLDLWLSDDLDPDRDAYIVVRQGLPSDPASCRALLRATPPRPAEAFPVTIGILRALVDRDPDRARWFWRAGELQELDGSAAIRPGDVVAVDSRSAWFEHGVPDPDGSEQEDDVLEETGERDALVCRLVPDGPLDASTSGAVADVLLPALLALVSSVPDDSRARRRDMAEEMDRFRARFAVRITRSADERLAATARLLRGRIADAEVTVGPPRGVDPPDWIVIAGTRPLVGDEEARQTWTISHGVVELGAHQDAVAQRVLSIAEALGLAGDLAAVLVAAGEAHDEGKRDARFQKMLRDGRVVEDGAEGVGPDAVLAKSGLRTPAQLRAAQAASGLPTGWRHEQLSAAVTFEAIGPVSSRDLTVRLVGTTHGHGRSSFPHPSRELMDPSDSLAGTGRALFDDGAWDAIVDVTHRTHGVWGVAYLEALLRAADGQVSAEGT